MTLEELAHTLPNGFHDSALKGLSIDYGRRMLHLEVSLKVGDPNGARDQRDDVRDAEVDIAGVVFLVIDPPSSASAMISNRPAISGLETATKLDLSQSLRRLWTRRCWREYQRRPLFRAFS